MRELSSFSSMTTSASNLQIEKFPDAFTDEWSAAANSKIEEAAEILIDWNPVL